MLKFVLAAAAAMLMVSTAQAAEFKLGSITYSQDEDDQDEVQKIFVRPATCLSAIRLDNSAKFGPAIQIDNVKVSYKVNGLGVDREKVLNRAFLRTGESTGWIAVPQKDSCIIAVLVEGGATWHPSRDGRLTVYGAN